MLFFTAATLCSCMLAPQDSASKEPTPSALPFKLSGAADVYYRYDLLNPKQAPYNNYTSFTNSHNSFELGMISLKAEHTIGKVGMVADVGFGRRAGEFSYNDSNTPAAIKQLYVSYSPTSKIKVTAGSWATHIGYESVDAYLNRNYSMSYMFSYGPFFHTGVKAEFSVSNKSVLMVGIANPTDRKTASRMPKMAIAQLATASKDDKLKAYFNYQGGKYNDSLQLHQGDMVLTYAVSSKFSFSYNGTLQARKSRQVRSDNKWESTTSWWGSALYINLDPAPWYGLTLRGEYLGDKKSLLGFNGNVIETTLSGNFKKDNLTIIPEFRLDSGSLGSGLFINNAGVNKKTTQSLLLAAIYHF